MMEQQPGHAAPACAVPGTADRPRVQAGLPAPRGPIAEPSARQAGKMVVPLLGVLAALSIGVAAVAIILQSQERGKRQAKERELRVALADNDDLKGKLQQVQQAKAAVEDELGHNRKDLTRAKEELAAAVQAQETLTKSVEDREQEIARLTRDLDQTKSEAKTLSGQLASLQSERDTARQQLAELEQAKGELESKVMELSDRPTVELGKVRVSNAGEQPQASAALRPALVPVSAKGGQIVVVNREYDFVVMNLGKNHGLNIGQEFQIVRNNQVLGKVKVEKVYDELSAAAILPESQKENIQEGDAIRAL